MLRSLFNPAVMGAVLFGLNGHLAAETEYKIPYDQLRTAGQDYLDACVSPKEVEAIAKKLKQQVETKAADSGMDEDRAMREIMLDWAAGNEGKIRRKEVKTIRQACYYFVRFIDKGFAMPWQIRVSLTQENVKTILDYLNGEVQKVKGGGEAKTVEESAKTVATDGKESDNKKKKNDKEKKEK